MRYASSLFPRTRLAAAVLLVGAISMVASACSSTGATPASASSETSTGQPPASATNVTNGSPAETSASIAAAPSAAAGPGSSESSDASGIVAFLVPDNTVTRWEQQDVPFFKTAMKKYMPNATVRVYNALGDPATQLDQANTALAAGAKVLVLSPQDTTASAAIAKAAAAQKVPVISYSRLSNGPVTYYIGKSNIEVGQDQGKWLAQATKDGDNIAILNGSPSDTNAHQFNQGYMSVLQPLFDQKKRTMVGNEWIPNYDPAKAQTAMAALLTKTHDDIQGVIAANDGIASGVIAALRQAGLAGKVSAITGLDATLAGVQFILLGDQGMSIMQPLRNFADTAAQISADLLQGKTPPSALFNTTTNNGTSDVPTHDVSVVPITKSNVLDTVDQGFYTKAQICKGIPAGTGPC